MKIDAFNEKEPLKLFVEDYVFYEKLINLIKSISKLRNNSALKEYIQDEQFINKEFNNWRYICNYIPENPDLTRLINITCSLYRHLYFIKSSNVESEVKKILTNILRLSPTIIPFIVFSNPLTPITYLLDNPDMFGDLEPVVPVYFYELTDYGINFNQVPFKYEIILRKDSQSDFYGWLQKTSINQSGCCQNLCLLTDLFEKFKQANTIEKKLYTYKSILYKIKNAYKKDFRNIKSESYIRCSICGCLTPSVKIQSSTWNYCNECFFTGQLISYHKDIKLKLVLRSMRGKDGQIAYLEKKLKEIIKKIEELKDIEPQLYMQIKEHIEKTLRRINEPYQF